MMGLLGYMDLYRQLSAGSDKSEFDAEAVCAIVSSVFNVSHIVFSLLICPMEKKVVLLILSTYWYPYHSLIMRLQKLLMYFNQHYWDNFHTDDAASITG